MQLSTATAERSDARYALGHSLEEYERLRRQARVWEAATERLLDQVGVKSRARCLDAGCGPGETMRLMAQRVGPTGLVVGIDADARLGEMTLARLHAAGHTCCRFLTRDLADDGPIPGAPYDLVYARLLLFHLPERAAVLARLWAAVAPGGHLIVQDYDLRPVGVLPALDSVEELRRVILAAFVRRGCDVHAGANLPNLFVQAGVGDPDATDVAGRIEPLATGRAILEQTFRSCPTVLPACAHAISGRQPRAATVKTSTLPREPAPPTVRTLLRAQTRYYERHVLAWYALGRVQESRAAFAAVCALRRRVADADQASGSSISGLDAHLWARTPIQRLRGITWDLASRRTAAGRVRFGRL